MNCRNGVATVSLFAIVKLIGFPSRLPFLLRPRSKLSYDPLFLILPLFLFLFLLISARHPTSSSPTVPSTFPSSPAPPFQPLRGPIATGKERRRSNRFPRRSERYPDAISSRAVCHIPAAADHLRIRPDMSEYPRVQFNRLVKFDRDLPRRTKPMKTRNIDCLDFQRYISDPL